MKPILVRRRGGMERGSRVNILYGLGWKELSYSTYVEFLSIGQNLHFHGCDGVDAAQPSPVYESRTRGSM
jgi:hypothetical protein